MRRQAGVVLPLFSIRTDRDWGIGQVTDLPACAGWIRRAGHSLLQLLPPHELSGGETSPYGALTAFGLDPIYVGVEAIEDLDAAAIDAALGADAKGALEAARRSATVDYQAVRPLKTRILHAAFEAFHEREWLPRTPRAKRFADFVAAEHAWLDDLALYTVLRESHGGWGWTLWPEDERDRAPRAIEVAREKHGKRLLEVAYVQWTLLEQWERARREMRAMGVELMGDLPFVVCAESADVWSRASQFQLNMSLGAPPDDFSADGQEWGLPPYDWLTMEGDDLAWLRARTRHAARLYDRFRLDHVVGYFRQWVRPQDRSQRGRFDPESQDAQSARGRRVLGAVLDELRTANAIEPPRAIAEDLGVIPPFVRQSLRDLQMPGYRVLPWEKDDGRVRDLQQFPTESVAAWSTHDTAPIVSWWRDLPEGDRAQFSERAGLKPEMDDMARSAALLAYLYRARSDLALVLAQELLGTGERINVPATVGASNWSWRLPRPIEDLERDPVLSARFDAIARSVRDAGR